MVSDLFCLISGVVCFFIGFVFGKIFGVKRPKAEPCETLEDVTEREG